MKQILMARSKLGVIFLGSDLVDFNGVTLIDSVGVMQCRIEWETRLLILKKMVQLGIHCLDEPVLGCISKESCITLWCTVQSHR